MQYDKKSGFWVNTRPDFDPEGSGSGRVGFDLPRVGFFRLGSPMVAKMIGRIGFEIFEFFDLPSIYRRTPYPTRGSRMIINRARLKLRGLRITPRYSGSLLKIRSGS